MEKTKITVELSTALYQQITSYAKHREISASAVVRFALLDYVEKNKIAPAPTAERPRELSPIKSFNDIPVAPMPTKPKPIDEALRMQVLDEWGDGAD